MTRSVSAPPVVVGLKGRTEVVVVCSCRSSARHTMYTKPKRVLRALLTAHIVKYPPNKCRGESRQS